MKNTDQEKQVWQTPEVIDLDINNETTKLATVGETLSIGPS